MLLIRKAAVLGAGVMGSSIAAHLANCGIATLLLDMPPATLTAEEETKGLTLEAGAVRNRLALKGTEGAKKAAFGSKEAETLVTAGNFEDDLSALSTVDWVVEAVVERLDIKAPLLARAAAQLHSTALLTTNTSGLSVNALAEQLPEVVAPRFFGTHFFNPVRHMHLIELIPSNKTAPTFLAGFHQFAERKLGKGVVVAKDSPNFIANRVGIFSTVYTIGAMARHGLTIEEADALTGKVLGRAGSATFGTSDLAGVDLLEKVVATQYEGAPEDEMREHNRLPAWVGGMIAKGLHGNKAGAGFYKDKRSLVIDPATLEYRPRREPSLEILEKAKKLPGAGERLRVLVNGEGAASAFVWDILAATLLYSAHRVGEVCDTPAGIDGAMRWGFGWELGPFEIWEALGFAETVKRMKAEGRLIPAWVEALAETDSPTFTPPETKAPAREVNLNFLRNAGKTLLSSECAALIDLGDGVACLEFRTKMNTVNAGVMEFTRRTLDLAGHSFDALVVGNQGPVFSAGADLAFMGGLIEAKDFASIDAMLKDAQATMAALKFAPVPVVAAPFGKVLGGGLEYALQCRARQSHFEVNMGLVELGVGLIPAAGGVKESLLGAMARTASKGVPSTATLMLAFEPIAGALVSRSAPHARELGFLNGCDQVTMNRDQLLFDAKRAALGLLETSARPLFPAKVKVAGRDGLAFFEAVIANIAEGGRVTPFDCLLMAKIAQVLCGGGVEAGSEVSESYFSDLEREAFLSLCGDARSLARIRHMLDSGKPLRN